MRTFDAKELSRRVDEVLYYLWDPIGVANAPCARAEYASYVPAVTQLVEQNDDKAPISEFLAAIIAERMELTPDTKKCDYVSALLLEHKRAIREGLA